jgi:2-(1,2-epoxy-1,2-dihydrophenyl)acetyl-CoA isomerase
MTESDLVTVDRRDHVAVVAINSPQTRNALGSANSAVLHSALTAVAADEDVRVVILTGTGGVFSAGADIREGLPTDRRIEDVINSRYRPSLELLAGMDKPVIAAVAGPAAGIGLSFALTCDLVVMAEDAYILPAFATIGLIPDGGATWLLARRLGYHRAYQLCVEAGRLTADECLATGLCNRVVASDRLLEETLAWAESLSVRAPLVLSRTKRAMRQAMHVSYGEAITIEAKLQGDCGNSRDAKEGVRAFFEKRPPKFEGR